MTSDNRRPPDDGALPESDDNLTAFESAAQYVRAQDLIEDLRAERRPAYEGEGEDDARLHATAALLHAAAVDGGTVDPSFAARLFMRLEAEQARVAQAPAGEAPAPPTLAAEAAVDGDPESTTAAATSGKPSGVSRRGLLWGSLGAAAAALTGAAVTAALEPLSRQAPTNQATPPASALVPQGAGIWMAVAALESLPVGAVQRFEAGAVIGYLQHTASGFAALSGVCTHMACLLQWNGSERTFDCPCHGGRFLASGAPDPGAPYPYPPLPAIQTKVADGQVWVYVIATPTDPQQPAAGATTTPSRGYGAGSP